MNPIKALIWGMLFLCATVVPVALFAVVARAPLGISISFIVLGVLAGLMLGTLVYTAGKRPIQRLAGTVTRFALGDLEEPVRGTRTDIFDDLVKSLESMRVRTRATTSELLTSRQQMEMLVAERTERLQRRADQLRTINNVGRQMVTLRNVDELLPFIADELVRAFKYENVNICLVDKEPDVLVAKATSGTYGKLPLGSKFKIGERGIIGWVGGSAEPLLVNDVGQEPRYMFYEALRETEAEMAVQIRLGDQVLGVLDIESRHRDAFDETDLSTAQTLADLIAVAIENARLYEQTRVLAVTEERNRLAREIHDTLAQGLTALSLQLEVADETILLDTDRASAAIRRALALTRFNLDEARRSVLNLRSRSLQQRSLAEAIRSLLDQHGRESGFYYSLRHQFDNELPPSFENGIYRVVQEAISNIAKHAQASEVSVDVSTSGESIVLIVEDDGVGFDPDAFAGAFDGNLGMPPGHFGLLGMQERVHLLGGTLTISSSPGEGTRIDVTVPLRARDRV